MNQISKLVKAIAVLALHSYEEAVYISKKSAETLQGTPEELPLAHKSIDILLPLLNRPDNILPLLLQQCELGNKLRSENDKCSVLICFYLKVAFYNNCDGFPFATLYSSYNTQLCKKLYAALSSALLSVFCLLSNPKNLLHDTKMDNASHSCYCGIATYSTAITKTIRPKHFSEEQEGQCK